MVQDIREVAALFDDAETLEKAVVALESRGFDRAAFSLLADEVSVESELGHRYQRVAEMEDNPAAPRETFFTRISRLEAEYGLPIGLASIGALTLAGIGGVLPMLVAASGGGGAWRCTRPQDAPAPRAAAQGAAGARWVAVAGQCA